MYQFQLENDLITKHVTKYAFASTALESITTAVTDTGAKEYFALQPQAHIKTKW